MTSDRHLALMALMRELGEPTKTYQRSVRLTAALGSNTDQWDSAVEKGKAALDQIEQTVRAWVASHPDPNAAPSKLEQAAVEARAALAALCYDLEDPGSSALGALYLLQHATIGVDAPKDDAASVLARRDAQVMRRCAEFVRDTYGGEWADDAAATLERDADITERGCPGFEKEYQGVSDAKRRLANCKHCGKPWAVHPVPAGLDGSKEG